jgi:hypothetical protein
MTRSLRLLLGALAAIVLLAIGGGLAAAKSGHHVAKTPNVSTRGDDGAENGTKDTEQEPAESDRSAGDENADAAQNHGSIVSKVARETPPGPEHGKVVSAVARANHGASKHAGAASKHSARDE